MMQQLCCFFSSRRRHTRSKRDWSSDVCSSDLCTAADMDSLRTAVVTGATSGIGREVALQLAELGWRVIAIGRDREALAELSRRSERLVPHAADLLTDELEELIPARVAALVHAAGISPSTGVEETT